MKLHDLKPAPGSRKAKRRVGRGIAAGQGKTAGRGTKGQKARAGGKIPAWFEGGQTPLHQRIPKLRGFTNHFKVHYEVVNIGDIARLVELGELEGGEMPGAKGSKKGSAPITVNQEILRAAGLVRRLDRPLKVLGGGELDTALFVVADAFTASARSKIEAAGGTVSVLEVPGEKRPALGLEAHAEADATAEPTQAATESEPVAAVAETETDTETVSDSDVTPDEKTPTKPRTSKSKARSAAKGESASDDGAPADDEAAPQADAPADEPKPKARKPRAAKTDSTEADA